nr:PREDICTED: zinc finger protein 341-like [Bemisia tabaci]
MASIFFSDLSGVESEAGLSMQSLLDTQSSTDHLGSGSDSVTDPCHANNIVCTDLSLDECDVFQCGKCQKLFTSFAQFINHKKLHGSGGVGGNDKTSLAESVILSDTDILSFSIDQNDLNSHVLTAVPAHSLFPSSDSEITSLQMNPAENSLTENIFATQMESDKGEVLFNEPSTTNQIFVTSEDSNFLSSSPLLSAIQTNALGERTVAVSIVEVIQEGDNSTLNSIPGMETSADTSSLEGKKQLCPFCSKPFLSKVDLDFHVQSHTGPRPYLCIVCTRTFTQKATLRKHMKSHKVWPKDLSGAAEANRCQFCAEAFASPSELKSHRLKHLDQKVYCCSQKDCEWTSPDLNTFLNHVTSHEVFGCHVCKQSFSSLDNLNVHQYIEHEQGKLSPKQQVVVEVVPEKSGAGSDLNSAKSEVCEKKQLKCPYCNKVLNKNFDLEQHIRSHTGERPFQCIVCGRAFVQKSHVKKHMASHKVWPMPITTLVKSEVLTDSRKPNAMSQSYGCQFCSEVFLTFRELKVHRVSHADRKVYKCIQNVCEWTSPDLDAFLEHLSFHDEDAKYNCHICHKVFTSLDDFGIHQYYHEISPGQAPGKNFRCKKCKRKFMSSELLKQHMQRDTHRHLCQFCNRVFVAERFLRKHLLIHAEDFQYECETCKKKFKTPQYLDRHMSVHSSSMPYPCPRCPMKFKRKDRLSRHLLLHEGVKKYKCSFRGLLGCDKEFYRKDKLKDHILTHYKSDRTVCDICDKDFKRFSALMKHRQICAANRENNGDEESEGPPPAKSSKPKQHKDSFSKAKCFDETEVSPDNDNVPTIEIVVMPVNKSTRMSRNLASIQLSALNSEQLSKIFVTEASSAGNSESTDSGSS